MRALPLQLRKFSDLVQGICMKRRQGLTNAALLCGVHQVQQMSNVFNINSSSPTIGLWQPLAWDLWVLHYDLLCTGNLGAPAKAASLTALLTGSL